MIQQHFIDFKGRKTITINRKTWEYNGELDSENHACGQGVATCVYGQIGHIYEGTFVNDTFEGIGK